MLGEYCKKFARRSLFKLKMCLAESGSLESPFDGGPAYPWLNAVLIKVMKNSKGSLRPHYTWGVIHSAYLAKVLGMDRISVIEFGVAGGNGLLALEKAALQIESIFHVRIDVYGFDTGRGLPKPSDYRDLPNLFTEGIHAMDFDKLQKLLVKSELIVGLTEETVPEFIAGGPAPVGFISFDLDFYSSTKAAFRLLEADYSLLQPRIHCYFDDITGYTYSEFTGERLAISEFNQSHSMKKISPIYCLKYYVPRLYRESLWPEKFYLAHYFDHPLYTKPDGLSSLDTSLKN